MPSKTLVQFGLTIVALTMILAFIDAAWLTHRGNKDGENGAIILGVISFMIFLPFAVVAIWGLKNSHWFTDKLLGHISEKVSDIAEDSNNAEYDHYSKEIADETLARLSAGHIWD
jgi:hypothetical protein